MRGIGPVGATSLGDSVGHPSSRVPDGVEIEAAHEDEGGHPDLREPFERRRVELLLLEVVPRSRELEGAPLHLPDQVSHGRIHAAGVAPRSVDPPREVRLHGAVYVSTRQCRLLRVEELPQVRRGLGEQGSTGSAEQERLHQLRVG